MTYLPAIVFFLSMWAILSIRQNMKPNDELIKKLLLQLEGEPQDLGSYKTESLNAARVYLYENDYADGLPAKASFRGKITTVKASLKSITSKGKALLAELT